MVKKRTYLKCKVDFFSTVYHRTLILNVQMDKIDLTPWRQAETNLNNDNECIITKGAHIAPGEEYGFLFPQTSKCTPWKIKIMFGNGLNVENSPRKLISHTIYPRGI